MSRRCLAVQILALTAVSALTAQEKIGDPGKLGSLGNRSRIGWKGVSAFAPDAILEAVYDTPEAWSIAHPSADRTRFLAWLHDRIAAGYRNLGYRDVQVTVAPDDDGTHLSVVVAEGELVGAATPKVEMEPRDERVVAAVLDALAHPSAPRYAPWRSGGPARFGDAALDNLRATILEACKSVGATAPEVALRHGKPESGTVALEIVLRGARPRLIGSLRFEGVDAKEAELVLEKIGFQPGRPASSKGLDELERSISAIGRYLSVHVVPPAPGSDPIDPLVIQLTPASWAPPWQDMPWAEMDLVRRASRDLVDRIAHHAVLHGVFAMSDLGGTVDLQLSRQAITIRVPDSILADRSLGALWFALDTDRGVQFATTACGEVFRIPWNLLTDEDSGALFWMSLSPSASPDGRNELRFGSGLTSNLTTNLDELHGETVIRVGSHFAAAVSLHGASLLSILEENRAPELENPGELILGSISHPDAVRIDRETAHARISIVDGEQRFELIDEPHPTPVFPVGRGSLPATTDNDALRLLLIALESLDLAGAGHAIVADTDQPEFRVPREMAPQSGELAAVGLGLALRGVAEQYPDESWPQVFARDLPWMFLDAKRAWPVVAPELESFADDRTCGPIAFGIVTLAMTLLSATPIARWAGARGAEACEFERAWSDIESLCPPGATPDRILRAVGAAWKAGAASLSPGLRDALKSADDDRSAARAGCQFIWASGAGDWLRARLSAAAAR